MSARRRVFGLVVASLGFVTAAAVADESYVDRARVVSADPVYVTEVVRNGHCARGDDAADRATTLGDVRSSRPGIGLGEVLREAAERPEVPACAPYTERRIVGYDVTLSYGGERWVRRMREHPGDSVPVRVRLTPSPGVRPAVHRRAGR